MQRYTHHCGLSFTALFYRDKPDAGGVVLHNGSSDLSRCSLILRHLMQISRRGFNSKNYHQISVAELNSLERRRLM